MPSARDAADGEAALRAALACGRGACRCSRARGSLHCPLHDAAKGGKPDLSVGVKNGNLLVHCFVCGTPAQAAVVTELRARGLWPSDGGDGRASTRREVGRTRWEIRAVNGELRATHERIDYSDGTKEFWWRRPDGRPGLGGTKTASLPLYGTERLAGLEPGAVVVVAEGEKAADAVQALGAVAVGTVTGAGNPVHDEAALRTLLPFRVVLWPDNDATGRAHMALVGRRLRELGASGLDLLEWPDAPPKGDAADFRGMGGDADALRRLLDDARPFDAEETGERTDGGDDEPWRIPTPFDAFVVPPFPTRALAGWQADFVHALAVATQTPPDMAGLFTLAAVSTAAARRVVVVPRLGFIEPINVYAVVILPPATRKSAVVDATTAPILEYERELQANFAPLIAERQQQRRLAEARLKAAESEAAKAPPTEAVFLQDEARARLEVLEATAVPSPPQLVADDATPEALGRLLAENRERVAVISAEGDLFEVAAGRYSDGRGNFAVLLKGHAGDTHKVNRVGRPPAHVRHPAITLAIAAQPHVLRGLVRKEGFRELGLLARIVYAVPANLVGRRAVGAPPVRDLIRAAYAEAVRALLEKHDPVEGILADPSGTPEPMRLAFAPDAQARHLAFEAGLEPRLGPLGDLQHAADWAGKLTGLVARFAGLLHLADRWDDPDPAATQIPASTVDRAIQLGEYALGHALAALGEMGADPATDGARHAWRWIAERGDPVVRRADLYQKLRGRFPRSADLDAPLRLLVEYGYLRERSEETDRAAPGRRGPQGRPPGAAYDVNPLALAASSGNAGNPGNGAYTDDGDVFQHSQHFRGEDREQYDDGAADGWRRVAI